MHVIIIGGGSAGMTTAHFLARAHKVTVLEKSSLLGGNIRTLNKNVIPLTTTPDLFIDNGVIEFHQDSSPGLQSLMQELGLELQPVNGGSTAMYLENGRSISMPTAILRQPVSLLNRTGMFAQLIWAMRHLIPIGFRMYRHRNLADSSLDSILGRDLMSDWIRMLIMYGYSIPYGKINSFPARMAVSTLARGLIGTRWVRLEGGVYSYIEQIIQSAGSNLSIELDQTPIIVNRTPTGVTVECKAGRIVADKIVFAQPPDQVLRLLADPSELEQERFSSWRANYANTVIHTDTSIYEERGATYYTEFDLFQRKGGQDAAYNAYLNRLCGLPDDKAPHYFLGYNLEDSIDPEKILDRQRHHTPLYTAQSARFVNAIKADNGHNQTYHAGAYLYDGLHEGAIQSALAIKSAFGL